jgi:hypothetical protein
MKTRIDFSRSDDASMRRREIGVGVIFKEKEEGTGAESSRDERRGKEGWEDWGGGGMEGMEWKTRP